MGAAQVANPLASRALIWTRGDRAFDGLAAFLSSARHDPGVAGGLKWAVDLPIDDVQAVEVV